MSEPVAPNGQIIKHKHAAALAAGAKALRMQARPYAFEAGLYDKGIHSATFKQASTMHKKLLRHADTLEALAGRRKGDAK